MLEILLGSYKRKNVFTPPPISDNITDWQIRLARFDVFNISDNLKDVDILDLKEYDTNYNYIHCYYWEYYTSSRFSHNCFNYTSDYSDLTDEELGIIRTGEDDYRYTRKTLDLETQRNLAKKAKYDDTYGKSHEMQHSLEPLNTLKLYNKPNDNFIFSCQAYQYPQSNNIRNFGDYGLQFGYCVDFRTYVYSNLIADENDSQLYHIQTDVNAITSKMHNYDKEVKSSNPYSNCLYLLPQNVFQFTLDYAAQKFKVGDTEYDENYYVGLNFKVYFTVTDYKDSFWITDDDNRHRVTNINQSGDYIADVCFVTKAVEIYINNVLEITIPLTEPEKSPKSNRTFNGNTHVKLVTFRNRKHAICVNEEHSGIHGSDNVNHDTKSDASTYMVKKWIAYKGNRITTSITFNREPFFVNNIRVFAREYRKQRDFGGIYSTYEFEDYSSGWNHTTNAIHRYNKHNNYFNSENIRPNLTLCDLFENPRYITYDGEYLPKSENIAVMVLTSREFKRLKYKSSDIKNTRLFKLKLYSRR